MFCDANITLLSAYITQMEMHFSYNKRNVQDKSHKYTILILRGEKRQKSTSYMILFLKFQKL